MAFTGFSQQSVTFLKDLAANNNKEWFEKHRDVYEHHIMEPLRQLVIDLGPDLKKIDKVIDTTPAVNKTISKIYRDTRFSKDKSPFRTGLWLSFRRSGKIWGNVPEFYFYFTPEEYQYGMGFYSATPVNMAKFREHIALEKQKFGKIIGSYNQSKYIIGGEEYKKRIPNDLPDEFQSWYQKRNLYVNRTNKTGKSFFTHHLKDEISGFFNSNSDLYRFLIESIGLKDFA
jgi:uncharacterized protein (TIGR02453 family)